MSAENVVAGGEGYLDRYMKWKAAKDAELSRRKQQSQPLTVLNPPTPMRSSSFTKPAQPLPQPAPFATPSKASTSLAQDKPNLPAPPSASQLSREEQLRLWREEREQAGLATPSRHNAKPRPTSPRMLGIKGSAQRVPLAPGTPQVVRPAENKQNIQIADARALALLSASNGRFEEARMILLQLRQADASIHHNPYWWLARAKVEEETKNATAVIQVFEEALKACHSSSYSMLEEGLRSFMMRQVSSTAPPANEVEEEVVNADADDQKEIAALLDSPESSPSLLISRVACDLTSKFEAMALKEKEDAAAVVVVKQEHVEEVHEVISIPVDAVSGSSQTEASSGSVIAYEQVKAKKKERQALGTEKVMTPVRRSARTAAAGEEMPSYKEALQAADYAFTPNAALAPRQGLKIAAPESVEEEEEDEKKENEDEEVEVKKEVTNEEKDKYGRFDTYAPSLTGARLVSRVASPATAASLVAITPVRRSRRLPSSTTTTASPSSAMVIPNPHVNTPVPSKNRKNAKK